MHEVTVSDDGYVYRDQRYRSLSQIARVITGTRWSGPAFFGLNAARAGKGKRIQQIADSIEAFEFVNPVLIGVDNGIVAGHGRVEAAKLLGRERVLNVTWIN